MSAPPSSDESLATLDRELARGLDLVARASSVEDVEDAQTSLFGRKAPFAVVERALGSLPEDERRQALESERETAVLELDRIDVTLPGRRLRAGSLHPLTIVQQEIVEIFTRMGYRVVEGPEVEDEWHNFDALNIQPDHPARTMMDTTYLSVPGHPELLLRAHTSPMQIRTMQAEPPPVYVVVPGRVFRNEAITAKNMPVFHQVEGLAVDKGIRFSDLKGTVESFLRELLGADLRVRMTPSFFPFVEPGAQFDVSCFVCGGSGCKTCAFVGWIETMGAGMVHPRVLENVGYNPERYTGFAFGMGYDRLAMIRFGIPDIRILWESDVRFLEQFEGVG